MEILILVFLIAMVVALLVGTSNAISHFLGVLFAPLFALFNTAEEEPEDDFAFHMECEDPKDCEEILKKVNDGRIRITLL